MLYTSNFIAIMNYKSNYKPKYLYQFNGEPMHQALIQGIVRHVEGRRPINYLAAAGAVTRGQ